MLIKRLSILLVAVAASWTTFAAETSGLQIRTTRPDARVTFEQSLADGKALVSVADAKQAPVLGLTVKDFAVARADVAGKVISVEPTAKTIEVARHVVLVVDNSYSMVERKAVQKMLGEVGAVLKTIRPIDDVHMVVFRGLFRGTPTMNVGDRKLHVETLQSNKQSELEAFAARACEPDRISDTTVLYEGMLAGLELLRGTPANDPRFLMVFSDGEEINSAFKGEVVSQAATEIPNLHAFAIDCMPGPKTDDFMASFASQNRGQAWKAGTGSALPEIYQQSATKQLPQYIVAYEFAPPAPPPPPPPTPRTVVFETAALFDFDKAVLKPEGMETIKTYREKARAELSSASKVKIVGHTDNVGKADYNMKLSLRRANAVRDYLVGLGVDPKLLEVGGEGMTKPIADNSTAEGRAKNRRVEITVVGTAK